MNEEEKQDPKMRAELNFFGRVMASISHEINNVLTIVTEVGGLLEDLTYMAENGRPINPEKLRLQCKRIADQMQRGKTIIQNMNRFAHSIDEPIVTFDLADAVRNTVKIATRFAELKKTTIEYEPPDLICSITDDPFFLRYIVFTFIDNALQSGAINSPIRVEIKAAEGVAEVLVISEHYEYTERTLMQRQTVDRLTEGTAWSVAESDENPDEKWLRLTVPLSAATS